MPGRAAFAGTRGRHTNHLCGGSRPYRGGATPTPSSDLTPSQHHGEGWPRAAQSRSSTRTVRQLLQRLCCGTAIQRPCERYFDVVLVDADSGQGLRLFRGVPGRLCAVHDALEVQVMLMLCLTPAVLSAQLIFGKCSDQLMNVVARDS